MHKSSRTLMAWSVLALLLPQGALAHEMFLKPQTHFPEPEASTIVTLVNGTFDKSENSITRDRMKNVVVVANGTVTNPPEDQWRDADNASHLTLQLGKPGTYVVGVSTKPRVIELSANDFDAYLKHDGVVDVYEQRQKEGTSKQAVKERYSKHVRTFVQVGELRTNDYSRELDYPVEIIPLRNPYDLKVGESLGFKVLFRGDPAARRPINVSYGGFRSHDAQGGHVHAYTLRTDEDGVVNLKITKPGKWYLSIIHMEQVDDGEVNYESNWATATFEVKP